MIDYFEPGTFNYEAKVKVVCDTFLEMAREIGRTHASSLIDTLTPLFQANLVSAAEELSYVEDRNDLIVFACLLTLSSITDLVSMDKLKSSWKAFSDSILQMNLFEFSDVCYDKLIARGFDTHYDKLKGQFLILLNMEPD